MSIVRREGQNSLPKILHCFALFAFMLACLGLSGVDAFAATKVAASFSSGGGYGRVVFTSPAGVPKHKQNISSGILVLSFGAPVSLDLSAFEKKLPDYIGAARQDADGKTLRLALTPGMKLSVHDVENSFYLDILPKNWIGDAPPLPADVLERQAAAEEARKAAAEEAARARAEGIAEPGKHAPSLSVRATTEDHLTRLVFDWNLPVLYSLVQKDGTATLTFDRAAKVVLSPIRADLPPYLTAINSSEHNGRLSIVMKLAAGITVKDFREELGIVVDLRPVEARKEAEAPKPEEVKKAEAAKPGPIKIGSVSGGDETTFIFPWTEPTNAAVFTRGTNLWVVFDRSAEFDLSGIKSAVTKNLSAPQVAVAEGGSAFVFAMSGPKVFVGATQEGTGWRVSVGGMLNAIGKPISLTRSWKDGGGGLVALDLRNASKIIEVKDPVVGDTLLVATAPGPVQSMQQMQSFVEFQALQTTHGVAIVRIADDVNIGIAPNAVTISRQQGLALSDGSALLKQQEAQLAHSTVAIMDFKAWRGDKSFIDANKKFLARIVAQPADTRDAGPRIDYAKFLLANGLGPEALIQLGLAEKANPKIAADPSFSALKGVAEYKSYHYADAAFDLSVAALAMDPNAAIWRGLSRAALGQLAQAGDDFEIAGPALAGIQLELASKVHIEAARAALVNNDPAGAASHLAALPKDGISEDLRAEAGMLYAELQDRDGKIDGAAAAYDKVAAINNAEVAVRARFEKAVMLNRVKKLDDDKLMAELDRLRMQWRGGDVERNILSKLAELHLVKGDVPEALLAMRYVTLGFPENDDARALGGRMPDIFADYFMDSGNKKLSAIDSLAFYYKFQALTPIGEKGDRMIRSLADRLVSVDLLPQAASLLRYQIDQRLHNGFAKAQVATSLAKIYLLDRKPEDALRTLHETAQNLLPDDLNEERLLIQARAFGELKKYDLALDLLSDIHGEASERLKCDVLWEAQRWAEAGAAAEALVAGTEKDVPVELTEEQRFYVMRSAIAYAMGSENNALGALHDKFALAMAKTDDGPGFDVVSNPVGANDVAFSEQVNRIASVNMIEHFVNSLKEKEKLAGAPQNSSTVLN